MRSHPYVYFGVILLQSLLAQAQLGDGGSADGFQNSNLGAVGTGADGSSNSSANLSKGAIIAISVVVAIVVVVGVTLAVLFYLAKKRQWKIRQTIRRTTSKVVRAMTPRSPHFTFPRSPRPGQQAHGFMERNKETKSSGFNQDVEKGFVSIDDQLQRSSEETDKSKQAQHQRTGSDVNKKLPKPKPTINVPPSEFEIDSPKSPMWQRILGRK